MPEIIVIEATNKCNLDCVHCMKKINTMGGADIVDIDLHLLDKILTQAEPFRTRIVSLTGGEPTLHSDWEGLIAVLEKHDVDYVFTTNGINFEEAHKVLVKNASKKFKGITFSIEGATAQVNDAVRGEGAFNYVVGAMRIAKEKGIPFGMQAVVGRHNKHELAQLAALAEELGADELNYILMRPSPDNVELLLSLVESDEVEEQVVAIKEAHKNARVKIGMTTGYKSPDPFFVCRPLSMSMISIDYNGLLRLCVDLTNYRGAIHDDTDIIANLNMKPLSAALKDLSNRINRFRHNKIDWVTEGTISSTDANPCLYCVRHFNKNDCMEM
ncbi:MAG: radical SAM protein [Candidatus Eremiobacteraeota bacterium]|nr:radical SAM protein [Candidatus Eremiobacteraeota bacterium]